MAFSRVFLRTGILHVKQAFSALACVFAQLEKVSRSSVSVPVADRSIRIDLLG